MKYVNIKKLIVVLSTGFVLISVSGCNKNGEKVYSNVQENSLNQNVETETLVNTEANNYVETEPILETTQNKEVEIINYFDSLEQEIDSYINEGKFEEMKEKAKNIAITGIDFIFYGKEIKGVTFEELTIDTKNKIMTIVSRIDSKIENKIPGYKDTIKDKFGQGYDYVSLKLDEVLIYIDGKLETEYGDNYERTKEKASNITEDVKEGASNVYEKVSEEISDGWSKIKEWYEEKTNKG